MRRIFPSNSFQKCRSSHSQMFFRSNRPEMFCKKAVLGDFPKFTRKHLCQSLFITKVAGQGRQLYLKKTLFLGVSCEFCEIWKNTFFTENLWWLLLVPQNRCSYKFPTFTRKYLCWSLFLIQLETWRPATLIRKRPQHMCFPVIIKKNLRIAVL